MVTTRERPERLRRAIAAGTAGRWTEEVVLFGPPSLPGASSDAWTLSREPERETPVLDPVGPNPSAATFIDRELNPPVHYFRWVGAAGTHILTESPIQPVYHVPADIIAGRIVENRAQTIIGRAGLGSLVREMAELVDSNFEPITFRGGTVVYQASIENPDDWEIVVVSRLNISKEKRFDISLQVGEALSHLITSRPYDPNWMHVTFSLELA